MNAQDQIKERARLASKAIEGLCYPYKLGDVQDIIEAELTTQQTAADAAHREEAELLTKERDYHKNAWLLDDQEHDDLLTAAQVPAFDLHYEALTTAQRISAVIQERDLARAESAKLREVLGKVTDALRGAPWRIGYQDDRIRQAKDALALAAPLLKEGE